MSMTCPWGCGWEGTPAEYNKHYDDCPNRKKKHPTIKELMKGEVLDGYIEAARVKPLTEFAEKKEKGSPHSNPEMCKALHQITIDIQSGRTPKEKGEEIIQGHIKNYHTTEGFCVVYQARTSFKGTLIPEHFSHERLMPILKFVTDKTVSHGWAEHDELHKIIEAQGYSHEEVDKIVDQLLKEGTIYSPKEGYYRKA